jgi:steroid delta-isomerase
MTSKQALFLSYLQHYAAKDLNAVAAMLADDVKLRDWNLSVVGKAAAVAETAKNFAAATSIAIEVLGVYENQNTVSGELQIVVDGSTELYVVDVIDFNAHGQIQAIRAYLGRGDGG